MTIKVGEQITLFEDENNPFWSCGIYTEDNKHHGKWIVFEQTFPDIFLGSVSEKVAIKGELLDKVIEFLQSIKEDEEDRE